MSGITFKGWLYFILIWASTPFLSFGQSDQWNLDFEIWDYYNTTPDLWFDTTIVENRVGLFPPRWHYRSDHIPEGTGLGRTTDATKGDYAIALSGFYQYQVMRIISGESDDNPGWPISSRPLSLHGDYKSILLGSCDSLRAYVDVFLTKFNELNNSRDTIGVGKIILSETSKEYQQFEVDINYSNDLKTPDTVIIILAKERFGFDVPPACLECGHVFFDNLNFSNKLSALNLPDDQLRLEVYPNPADEDFWVHTNCEECSLDLSFYNSQGKLIQRLLNVSNKTRIETSNFSKGIYFITLQNRTTSSSISNKLIIQ